MKSIGLSILIVISTLCYSQGKKSKFYNPREEELSRTTGKIIGVVTDKITGEPLEGVMLSAQYMGDISDSLGRFDIPYQKPGTPEVVATRRDLISTVMKVKVSAGKISTINIEMDKGPKPCCNLQGNWRALLILDKAGTSGAKHIADSVEGTIYFNDSIPNPFEEKRKKVVDLIKDEFGRYAIDLRPFFGDQVPQTGSTSVFGSKRKGSNLFTEASGYIAPFDVVVIDLIPRMSHGGVTMNGKISSDTISGSWYLREYAGGTEGRFRMYRSNK
jgi:hypothetical protein